MSLIHKALNVCVKRRLLPLKCYTQLFHTSNLSFAEASSKDDSASSKDDSVAVYDILEELREPELTEEEILQKQFKARLPEDVYRKFILKEPRPLEAKYDLQMKRLRANYARFGKSSRLNPGLCWPTRAEILETAEYDKIFEPPLETKLKNAREAQMATEEQKREVEAEVDKNMANLDKWISEYYGKIEKKKAEVEALKQKKEKLIDEICEYLGYDIDPRDPRFQEAVDQREKEQKKARKVKKQQESYEKMIAKLKQMADK